MERVISIFACSIWISRRDDSFTEIFDSSFFLGKIILSISTIFLGSMVNFFVLNQQIAFHFPNNVFLIFSKYKSIEVSVINIVNYQAFNGSAQSIFTSRNQTLLPFSFHFFKYIINHLISRILLSPKRH